MKKFTKVLLALTLIAAMVVPMAVSSFAKELTPYQGNYTGMNTGCGFLDGNVYCEEGFAGEDVDDLTVTVNGKPAYINNGYLGNAHTGLQSEGEGKTNNKFWVGVVGAEIVEGENTMVVTDKAGDTLTYTFNSSTKALGTSYAKVVSNLAKKTVKAEIAFFNDPGFAIGTEFEGKCHDEHGTTATFKVTKYDEATKIYTIEAKDYAPSHSVLELKVTSEGEYKDYFVSANIHQGGKKKADKGVEGDMIKLVSATSVQTGTTNAWGNASNLIDGFSNPKAEGGFPEGGVTITVEAKEATKAATLVLYTNDDGDWNNRAPKTFKVYASNTAGEKGVEVANVEDSGIQNVNHTPFAFKLNTTEAYKYYTIEISSFLGTGWVQVGEVELYTGDVTITDEVGVVTLKGDVAYNGTKPEAPVDPDTPVDPKPETKVPETGDVVVIATLLSVVSLAGTAFVSKKRR